MKRYLALLLAALMVLSLCACAKTSTDTPKEPETNNDAQTPADTGDDAQTPTDADDTAVDTENGIDLSKPYAGKTLPLTENGDTFRFFRATGISWEYFGFENYDDIPGYQAAVELTGVNIDWEPVSDFDTQFPLMIASGDWADCAVSYINGGTLTNYVGDEVLQDLTDYIPEYAPLYQIRRTDDAAISRDTSTDEGQLVAFYNIKQTVQGSWSGPWVRADWLAEYGADSSDLVTYDDWLNFLVWAKDKHSDTLLTPYNFDSNGLDRWLLTGYGLSNDWIVEDGEVKYSVTQPAFKDYMTMCADWYSKGAISDFVFSGDRLWFDDYAEGGCAIAMTFNQWWDTIYKYAEQGNVEGFEACALSIPKKNADDLRRIETGGCPTTRNESLAAYIFTSCDDIPLLCQWFDFWYTDEGSLLADYGIEGESYTFDENGKPQFTDKILNSPEGYGLTTAWREYVADGIPHFYDWTRENTDSMPPAAKTASEIWDKDWVDELTYPQFATRTTQEAETYSSIMSDIDTMVKETLPKFVRGDMAMSEWDSFVASLEQMRIGEARDIQQAAYERYMER